MTGEFNARPQYRFFQRRGKWFREGKVSAVTCLGPGDGSPPYSGGGAPSCDACRHSAVHSEQYHWRQCQRDE